MHGPDLDLPKPRRNAVVITFRVDDLAEATSRLRAAGTELTGEVRQEWGSYAYFEDPEGNLLQLYSPKAISPG